MAKLAKTMIKNGNVEAFGIREQYTLENKEHLIDALSLLDDPTQIRIFISASQSNPMIQLDDTQKLETLHKDVSISFTKYQCRSSGFHKTTEINKFSHRSLFLHET